MNFFLNPTGLSVYEGSGHRTMRLPVDLQERKDLFRRLIEKDSLQGEDLEGAVQEMMTKAEAYKAENPSTS